jgi:peptidyl-prolyl cis-trans isomerase B (cyclophilin B)
MRRRLLVTVLAAASLALLAGCSGGAEPAPTDPATPTWAGACGYVETGDAAREVTPPPAESPYDADVTALLQTSAGDIPMTLDAAAAPCTVGSFASLVAQGYYDGTDCHRLTTTGIFVLQCGDPSGTGRGGPGYTFADELDGSETYPAGTVAMANAGAGTDTNGSQFFLVYQDTELPPSYTVFGTLEASGLAVVQQIAAGGVAGGGAEGVPATPLTIHGVTLEAVAASPTPGPGTSSSPTPTPSPTP